MRSRTACAGLRDCLLKLAERKPRKLEGLHKMSYIDRLPIGGRFFYVFSENKSVPFFGQPKVPFPAQAEAGAGDADHVACETVNVEETGFHVCARRNSIRKHTKSQ